MPIWISLRQFFIIAAACLAVPSHLFADPIRVRATAEAIEIAMPGEASKAGGDVAVVALPLAGGGAPAQVYNGSPASVIRFARVQGGRDLAFARFQVGDAEPQFVTEFGEAGRAADSRIGAGGKKGLACVHDLADAEALGVRHLARNVRLGDLVDWRAKGEGEFGQVVDGERIAMRPGAVRALDGFCREAGARGMSVTAVFYNQAGGGEGSPLIHPSTDLGASPTGVTAFNTATPEGVRHLRAALEFLADRYVRPGQGAGRIDALVVGNEVNSHWMWHHQGDAAAEDVARDYHAALRLAWLAIRSRSANAPVYVSLDHHWTSRHLPEATRAMSGRELLEKVGALSRAGGDFDWAVAYHPYPENLFDPAFWKDRACPDSFDAPKISFKNIEVLTRWLDQPDQRCGGKARRISLTEQGFHCGAGPQAEALQAEAYRRAFAKVAALPQIDAFIYHRHVDSPHEGGLSLGVREFDAAAPHQMGRPRAIWEAMQQAGEEAAVP